MSPAQVAFYAKQNADMLADLLAGMRVIEVQAKHKVNLRTVTRFQARMRAEGKLPERLDPPRAYRPPMKNIKPLPVLDKRLWDREDVMVGCLYPVEGANGKDRACGEARTRGSFCAHHAVLCYVEPKQRTQKSPA